MSPPEIPPKADMRDYLAAERTFLAWERTGLAMMGFGFVVARFGLFLQQVRLIEHAAKVPSYGVSLWFGIALIGVGIVVNVASVWRHVSLIHVLNSGLPVQPPSLALPVASAVFLAVVGLSMAIYLFYVHR